MKASESHSAIRLVAIILLPLIFFGVWLIQNSKELNVTNPNELLLKQVCNSTGWFHAKKTRPIWARRVVSRETVTTLEGTEQVDVGQYLCRGEAGDIWPQTEKDLLRRYTIVPGTDSDGWQKYIPHPDAAGVIAIQMERPFQVIAAWGTLHGKAGDFLLKNFEDRDNPNPIDLWLVDQRLFCETYERQHKD